jgi:hypothetical protein
MIGLSISDALPIIDKLSVAGVIVVVGVPWLLSWSMLSIADKVKTHLSENRFFTNVFGQWLKRYLFPPGKNNCSCAVESERRLSMCSGPFY